jgi:hypothetical protein
MLGGSEALQRLQCECGCEATGHRSGVERRASAIGGGGGGGRSQLGVCTRFARFPVGVSSCVSRLSRLAGAWRRVQARLLRMMGHHERPCERRFRLAPLGVAARRDRRVGLALVCSLARRLTRRGRPLQSDQREVSQSTARDGVPTRASGGSSDSGRDETMDGTRRRTRRGPHGDSVASPNDRRGYRVALDCSENSNLLRRVVRKFACLYRRILSL